MSRLIFPPNEDILSELIAVYRMLWEALPLAHDRLLHGSGIPLEQQEGFWYMYNRLHDFIDYDPGEEDDEKDSSLSKRIDQLEEAREDKNCVFIPDLKRLARESSKEPELFMNKDIGTVAGLLRSEFESIPVNLRCMRQEDEKSINPDELRQEMLRREREEIAKEALGRTRTRTRRGVQRS